MDHSKFLTGNVFESFLLCIFISLSNELECYTEQQDDIAKVNCSATLYKKENCNESYLETLFPHLYGKDEFPGGPHDLTLQPIQELYSNSKYYPGFEAFIKPPVTYDIGAVRGFQLDYSDADGGLRCIILEIHNTSLSSVHSKNNLRLKVKIYPLGSYRDFTFIAFSLPTPKIEEKETETRYGRSGKSYAVDDGPSTWITTISYFVNIDEKYVDFRFAAAPTRFNFTSYDIYLSQILANEGTPQEIRNTTGPKQIREIEYKFENLSPGRYRIEVSPHDDGTGSDCKCKNKMNLCETCTKTVTSVINMPTEGANGHVTSSIMTSTHSTTVQPSSTVTDATTSSVLVIEQKPVGNDNAAVLPSTLGVAAFIIVAFVVVGCYMFNRSRIRGMFPPTKPKPKGEQALNNQTFTIGGDPKHSSAFTVSENGLQQYCAPRQHDVYVALNPEHRYEKLASSRLDSGYKSHDTNSFDETDWRKVRQDYILNDLINKNQQENVVGNFLIGEESQSLMPEEISIAPAMTIAEGEAGNNPYIKSQHSNRNSVLAVDKYGHSTRPNIPSANERDKSCPPTRSFTTNESGGFSNHAFVMPHGQMTDQEQIMSDFEPPEPSVLDDDITTQYQVEVMRDINKPYLSPNRRDSQSDNGSGYSV